MSYTNDSEVVFTTLAIGERYREVVATQIQSVLKFTHHDLYVITDDVNYFGNYYGPRIHYVPFSEESAGMPLYGKQGQFNADLKLLPLKYCFENTQASVVVFLDADVHLFGWQRNFLKFFPVDSGGIWARQRHKLNDSAEHPLVIEKAKLLNLDYENIELRLPIEACMFWKRCEKTTATLNAWKKYADLVIEKGARSDFESITQIAAMYETGIPYYHVGSEFPACDDFHVLHNNKILKIFII